MSLLTACLTFCAYSSLAEKNAKYLKGDGYEYMIMTESLANHLTPNARLKDVYFLYAKINALTHPSPDNYRFPAYMNMIQKGEASYLFYYQTADHHYYSCHFWLYSLINLPSLYLTRLLNLSPVYCFLITHCIIFFLTSLYLLTTNGFSIRQRVFIFTFYIFSGTTYYLNWFSPEIFTASLLLCGLLLLLQKKPLKSAFLMALAAQQNPPIGLIAFGVLSYSSLQSLKTSLSKKSFKEAIYRFLPIISILLILGASPLFYYIHFKTPSLIVTDGYSKAHLITLYRLFSLFFDLDQGMIIAIPSVLLIFALSLLFAIGKAIYTYNLSDWQRKNIFTVILMIFISLVLAIPSLSAPNWNCGMSVFLRYAYWISMPIGVATMLLLNMFSRRIFYFVFVLYFICQITILTIFSIIGNDAYLSHKKIASYLISYKPEWYNPIPAIFIARELEKDIFSINHPLDKSMVYYHVNQSQHSIRKILYNPIKENTVLTLCHDKTVAELTQITRPVITEDGWRYLNIPPGVCHTSLPQGLIARSQK